MSGDVDGSVYDEAHVTDVRFVHVVGQGEHFDGVVASLNESGSLREDVVPIGVLDNPHAVIARPADEECVSANNG